MLNEKTIATHQNCITCGKPYRIRLYRTNGVCSDCTRWRVIKDDMERVSRSGSTDYAEWDAAV